MLGVSHYCKLSSVVLERSGVFWASLRHCGGPMVPLLSGAYGATSTNGICTSRWFKGTINEDAFVLMVLN